MDKLSKVLVEKRKLMCCVMLLFTVISIALMAKVNINTDMTKYLADDSQMKQGVDLMAKQFPNLSQSNTIRVMLEGLSEERKAEIAKELSAIQGVDSVTYDSSEIYNKGDYTLYLISTAYEYGSDNEVALRESISERYNKEEGIKSLTILNGDTESRLDGITITVALVILLVILFVMCNSWIEPVIFLFCIGIAVIINMGTNAFLPSVSDITHSIVAILQLVLSMDYSIILMSRYRQERKNTNDKEIAMREAVKNAFASITSSAFTTFVGLLMLIFLNYKLGMDLGIVLAKGVLCSWISIFTILPTVILKFEKILDKTAKKALHIPMGRVSTTSYKLRRIMPIIFIMLFFAAYILQTKTDITFSMSEKDEITEIFPTVNTTVVLYNNDDSDEIEKFATTLKGDSKVVTVMSYPSLFAKQNTAVEMADEVKSLVSGLEFEIDDSIIRLLYYTNFSNDCVDSLTINQLLDFVKSDVQNKGLLSMVIDDAMLTQIDKMQPLMQLLGEGRYTPEALSQTLKNLSVEVEPDMLELLYLYYSSETMSDENWTMSIEEMFNHLSNNLINDSRFTELIDDSYKETIVSMSSALNEGIAQLSGPDYSIMMISSIYPYESDETHMFIKRMVDYCESNFEKDYYMIGSSVMYYEMAQSFKTEMLWMTLLTAISIYIIVAVAFKSITVPALLVMVVQCAVFITAAASCVRGQSINYLAYLIVQCILMGATIDYGILFVNYYRENRNKMGVFEALREAYQGSVHTILTSGLILIMVTGIIGTFSNSSTIAPICITIALGTTAAVLLILFVLPGVLAMFDKLVCRNEAKIIESN